MAIALAGAIMCGSSIACAAGGASGVLVGKALSKVTVLITIATVILAANEAEAAYTDTRAAGKERITAYCQAAKRVASSEYDDYKIIYRELEDIARNDAKPAVSDAVSDLKRYIERQVHESGSETAASVYNDLRKLYRYGKRSAVSAYDDVSAYIDDLFAEDSKLTNLSKEYRDTLFSKVNDICKDKIL